MELPSSCYNKMEMLARRSFGASERKRSPCSLERLDSCCDGLENRAPWSRAWIDQLEVLHIRQQYQLADIPALYSLRMVTLADFVWYGRVARAMYQGLGDAKRKQFSGASACIAVRYFGGSPSHEDLYDTLAQPHFSATDEIHRPSKRNGPFEVKRFVGPQWVPTGESMPGRGPERQVPSSGEAYRYYPGQVQTVSGCDCSENVDSRTDVLESTCPTTSCLTNTTVLNIPSCKPRGSERCAQVCVGFQTVSGTPPTSMDTYNNGKRAFSLGQAQLTKLARKIAVLQTFVERRQGAG